MSGGLKRVVPPPPSERADTVRMGGGGRPDSVAGVVN